MMTKMKFFAAVALVATMATAAAAAQRVEVHSWEDLQKICRVPLAAKDPQGNPTNDGGRLGYLRDDVEWVKTDDWDVLSGSPDYLQTGDTVKPGRQFYAWFLGGNSTPSPTPAPAPAPVSNDRPAPVTPAGDLVTFVNLSQYGKVTQRDSLWMVFVPFQACCLDLAVFAAFDTDDFNNEIVGTEGQAAVGQLRQGGHYLLVVRELFREFVPETEDDFSLLSHPKNGGARWRETRRPEGHVYECYTVDNLAADWAVAPNCYVLSGSEIRRKAGEVIGAGSEVFLYIEYRNTSPEKGDGGDTGSGGGGGGCDSGMGSFAILAVATFLLRKGRY